MAVNTGVNISKAVGYAAMAGISAGVGISKAVAYAVLTGSGGSGPPDPCAKHQRGNIDFDQVRLTVRQGSGGMFQMYGGGGFTSGHMAVFDVCGNVVDGGAPGTGGGGSGSSGSIIEVDGTSVGVAAVSPITLQTNGTTNATQNQLNLVAGTNVTLTDSGTGNITIASSGGGGGGASWLPTVTAPPAYASWTWLNQGTATGGDSVSGTGVYIYIPTVSGTNWRILKRPAPATPWTAVIAFGALFNQSGNTRSGIVLYNSSSTKMTTWGPSCDGARSIDQWNSPTSFSSGGTPFTPGYETRWPLFFYRVGNDGTNLTFSISMNGGAVWIPITTQTLASFMTSVTDIGFGLDSEGNTYDAVIELVHSTGF